jgi:hypothetical protein
MGEAEETAIAFRWQARGRGIGSMKCLESLDGRYKLSEAERAKLCADAGHPMDYLNLSVSGKVGYEVSRCHCGVVDEAPAALKSLARARRLARAASKSK